MPMNTAMATETTASVASIQADYQRAVDLLREGRWQEGLTLLGHIARVTPDESQRSLCLYNAGEVFEKVGRTDEAYDTWYTLAHRPVAVRNKSDVMARHRVQRVFEARGLRVRPPDFPIKVQLEITNRCNLRCIMCTRNQMRRPLGDMSLEVFRRVADEVAVESGTVLSLYFLGEPLLNRQLESMVSYLRERIAAAGSRIQFGIQTNGMLLDRDRARSLLEAGLRDFAFSVDGLEGDLERVRPGASYPVVERNILGLMDLGRRMGLDDLVVGISKLCDDPQADEVRRFRERWEGRVPILNLLGISRHEGNSFMAADGSIREVAARGEPKRRVYCGEGHRLLVLWNGDFAFCCSDVNRSLDLGNVRDRSIRETWHSSEMRQIRRKLLAAEYADLPDCQRCPLSCVW